MVPFLEELAINLVGGRQTYKPDKLCYNIKYYNIDMNKALFKRVNMSSNQRVY